MALVLAVLPNLLGFLVTIKAIAPTFVAGAGWVSFLALEERVLSTAHSEFGVGALIKAESVSTPFLLINH